MGKQSCCLILAAGEGKRMKSETPKVLCEILFKPMISWVLDAVKSCGIEDICVVVGHKSDILKDYLNSQGYNIEIAYQSERKGTAHAVMSAESFLKKHTGKDVLILGGDSPFIDANTIEKSHEVHLSKKNFATVITALSENPYGYGRIIRNETSGEIAGIVEEKDASEEQKQIREVNSGMYWFSVQDLMSSLGDISEKNSQNEYYLTSIIRIFIEKKLNVSVYKSLSDSVILGANDCMQLQSLNEIARKKLIKNLLNLGVNIPIPDGVVIGKDAKINPGTTILLNTVVSGKTFIGKNCTIGPFCEIIDCKIGDNCKIKFGLYRERVIPNNEVMVSSEFAISEK